MWKTIQKLGRVGRNPMEKSLFVFVREESGKGSGGMNFFTPDLKQSNVMYTTKFMHPPLPEHILNGLHLHDLSDRTGTFFPCPS